MASIYKTLKYVVECKPGVQVFFEPIAAFNVDRAALNYAKECAKANCFNVYRVMHERNRGKRLLVQEFGL